MSRTPNRKKGRRPGLPDMPSSDPFRRWSVGLGLRVGAIFAGGILLINSAALWEPSDPVNLESDVNPRVVELAPTLVLPSDVNERVDKWMGRYLTSNRPAFERFLAREGLYSRMIRQKLRERGMPEDLLYMVLVESGFSTRARSRVSATGLWQFMGPTAREYGLRIDEYVDERRDPIRATDAALDYLEKLYEQFGSWYLAAAAYNAGPSRVARALRRHDGSGPDEGELYWEVVDHLPMETREYVPKILAATLLARDAEQYGFNVVRADPYRFDRVWVPGGTSLRTVAQALDLPVSLVRDLNPHLILGMTPLGTSYGVRVPPGRSADVVAFLGSGRRTRSVDD